MGRFVSWLSRGQVLRPSEKFKFNFDWDAKDDTSRDLNPLYNNLHGGYLQSSGCAVQHRASQVTLAVGGHVQRRRLCSAGA
jgi:hypothetical protein